MQKEWLQQQLDDFMVQSRWNHVQKEEAITTSLIGLPIFDLPLLAYGSAADPLFTELLQPSAVGPQMLLPKHWLPGAKTVISIFYPFSEAVRCSNRGSAEPSAAWLHGRIEGQRFIEMANRHLMACLEQAGYLALAPALDPRFRAAKGKALAQQGPWQGQLFNSNWSERHAAYVCGLGTFGLSKGIITAKGMAGRLASIITDAEFLPTPRPYRQIYEYCLQCGACAGNCPAQAIDLRQGKDHVACGQFIAETMVKFAPRYGCGKCQVGVPCEYQNPILQSE